MKKITILLLILLLLSGCGKAQPELTDGVYTMEVTLSGGSGRANVLSPARVEIVEGAAFATIQWSSPNYDYMLVEGQRYDALSMEGGSVFRIPVSGFNAEVPVIADTIAMSTPHEIAYTLFFDGATAEAAE